MQQLGYRVCGHFAPPPPQNTMRFSPRWWPVQPLHPSRMLERVWGRQPLLHSSTTTDNLYSPDTRKKKDNKLEMLD